MTLKKTVNELVVRVDKSYHDTVKHGSLELHVDPMFNKAQHAVRVGEVISVPDKNPWGIKHEVKPGDKVFLHFNAVEDGNRIEVDDSNDSTSRYYTVPYNMVFCVLDENGDPAKMIGGRILCTPVYDEDVEEIEVDGMTKTRVKKSAKGIIKEINVKHNIEKAVVAHIGTPIENEPVIDVAPGEVVYYEKFGDFENVINGKSYFCMVQSDIIMKE